MKTKKTSKSIDDKDNAIKDCRILLGMIVDDLRHPILNSGLDALRAQNLRCRLEDLVIHLAQLHEEIGTHGEMRGNLEYYLEHRNRYDGLNLRWVCSKRFERH